MKNILTQVLEKIGKNYEELRPDEKATFDNYEKILSSGKVTIEKLAEFLQAEIEKNSAQLTDMNIKLNDRKDLWLKMAISRDKVILGFIKSPELSAKKLEDYLRQLHKLNN